MNNMKRKINNKSGFTLAEALVTVAVITAVLALSFIAYTQWIRNAQFRRNNVTAETMFSVLQSELSERRAGNTLEDVETITMRGGRGSGKLTDGTSVKTPGGADTIDYQSIYLGYHRGANDIGPERGPIYYIKGTAADWAAYNENPSSLDSQPQRMIYDILSEYMFNGDQDLLNGSICVEFDPAEGMVYSVFFSAQADELTYQGDDANLIDRTEKARRKHKTNGVHDLVGYCGVETLSISTSKVTTKPIVQNLTLNNEETLNLTFNLNIGMATKLMSYAVSVFDADSDTKLLTIEMNNITLDEDTLWPQIYKLQNVQTALADCRVTRYENDKKQEQMMTFPAWLDDEGKITLVLDAVDYHTASQKMQDAYAAYAQNENQVRNDLFVKELKNTFSIYRLGIENTDSIYCTVYAEGGGFSTTATKTSNTTNRAFRTSDREKHSFTIANARHLYNLRFEETGNMKAAGSEFTLRNDVDVNDIQVYSNYKVPDSGKTILSDVGAGNNRGVLLTNLQEESRTLFPSFAQLGAGSAFASKNSNAVCTVKNLCITKNNNIQWMQFDPASEDGQESADTNGTGLFLVNRGTIQDVQLSAVTVDGTTEAQGYHSESTGSFCGTNAGTLENLKTLSAENELSSVKGGRYTGGIFGRLGETALTAGTNSAQEIKNLSNAAVVTGNRYVGGIIGLLAGKRDNGDAKSSITLKKCDNYGLVLAAQPEDAYIGGIVGLADSVDVSDCISNPWYGSSDKLNGYFVGGIVGLACDTQLADCTTKLQKGYNSGSVYGSRYVGGIAGLVTERSIADGSASRNILNEANVSGNAYVGGIVGCNADVIVLGENENAVVVGETEFGRKQGMSLERFRSENGKKWYEKLDPAKVTPLSVPAVDDRTVSVGKWQNKGVVTARDYYAGGIAGYNTGRIVDCDSNVYRQPNMAGTCDYAGGIVGYNNGTMCASQPNKTLNVECVVTGRNFIGGVVGYNDVNAAVQNYKVIGGTVQAASNGAFVGGYAGLNASENLLQDENGAPMMVVANLNRVSGGYAVGGTIGGNIVPVSSNSKTTVRAAFNVDNFRGSIDGQGIVGGYIGYNAMPLTADIDAARDSWRGQIRNNIASVLNGSGNGAILTALRSLETFAQTYGKNPLGLEIGEANGKITTMYSSSISGRSAVGGVIGYNSDGTTLKISNVENKAPVTATEAIRADQLQGMISGLENSAVNKGGETYSLVGGIIGIIGEKTTLINCRNSDIGDVNGRGTYLGGLTEANLGQIKECCIAAIGNAGHSFAGGLAGVNFGRIDGTKAINTTVTGSSYVGGITSENYGLIVLDGAMNGLGVQAMGGYAGGVTGYNGLSGSGKHGTIEMRNGLTGIEVKADSNVVGGVIGLNQGGNIKTGSSVASDAAAVSGRITGADSVGGIIGEHKSGNLTALMNTALVTATGNNGNAAGIVGSMDGGSGSSILGCVNKGTVLSSTGNAAGIVGVNNAVVKACSNEGSVTAPGGSAGGICVQNDRDIIDCATTASGTEGALMVQGYTGTGGIAARNNGTIRSCTLRNVTVTNYNDSPGTCAVGGMVGTNTGVIELKKVQTADDTDEGLNAEAAAQNMIGVTVQTNVNGTAAGGIAGCNDAQGVIDGGVADTENEYTISGENRVVDEASEKPAPTGYTLYDYVETKQGSANSQGSYFDTGYAASSATKVVFDGCVISGDTALFGARTSAGSGMFGIQYASDKTYNVKYGNLTKALDKTLGIRSVFTMDSTAASQIGVEGSISKYISYSTTQLPSGRTILIGGLNTNGMAGNFGQVRMYSMEIREKSEDTEVLLHKFMPAADKKGNPGILDIADPDNLRFIPYSSKGGSFDVELGGAGHAYETIQETWQNNLTISVGSAVTFANIGNVVGINKADATVQNVTVKKVGTDASVSTLLGGEDYGYGGIIGLNNGKVSNARFSGEIKVTGSSAAIANVGGIAGKNLAEGTVADCTVGQHGQTTVRALDYGYVGGITGWNLGSVESCDNRTDENDEAEWNVLISNNKGHTGGIIGNQAPGSYLGSDKDHPIATGSNWSVLVSGYANDCGTGGIIGYSESGNQGQDLAYLVNNASVQNIYAIGGVSSMAIGGIAGRFQNNENGAMVFDHCENNGVVSAAAVTSMAGGIVGRMKYLGATFEECKNTGSVTGKDAGGIMGDIYAGSTPVRYISCLNTGNISAGTVGSAFVGGITGFDADDGKEAWIFDCVNTGEIRGNSVFTGGIIGRVNYPATAAAARTQMSRCRNYGEVYVNTSSSPGGIMYTAAQAAANDTSGVNRVLVQDSFDFRTEKSMLSTVNNSIKAVDSYFYSGALSDKETTALKNWSGAMNDGTAADVKSAVAASGSLHSADNGKSGLPLSYYRDGDVLHLSSYRVYDVERNPAAGIGIPNRSIDNAANAPYSLGGVNAKNLYTYLEEGGSDSLIQRYYRDKYAALTDTAVKNLKLKQTGGVIALSWTAIPDAYAYKVCYEICDENGNTIQYAVLPITYGTTCSVSISEEWNKYTLKAHVRAASGAEDPWSEQIFTDKSDMPAAFYWTEDKAGWASTDLLVKKILPTPDVYLELDAMTSTGSQITGGNYVAVLRNTEAYDEYLKDYPEGTVVNISVSGAGTYTISYVAGDPMSAHAKAAQAGHNTSGNVTLAATATQKDADSTNTSLTSNQQTWLVGGSILKRLTLINAEFNGFSGSLPEELVFGLHLAANKSTSEISTINNLIFVYQESELIANRTITAGNQSVNVPMVVSGNVSRMNRENTTQDIVLDDLPENLLEGEDPLTGSGGFTVRSYLLYGQNNAYFTGHEVGSGLTADELPGLTDVHRNGALVFSTDDTGNTALNNGYVVQQIVAEDGTVTYAVRYNALLADEVTYKNNINSCTYTYDPSLAGRENNLVKVNAVVKNGQNKSTAPIQPYPLVEHVPTKESAQYRFTWGDSPDMTADADAQYYLQLYGRDAVDNSRVLLKTPNVLDKRSKDEMGRACYTSDDGWQYTFVDTEEKWNYADIFVRVTKVGTVSDGVTTIWPYYNECSVHMKQRFTTMTAPTIAAPEDSGTLDYRLWWNTIPDAASDDFLCYEVTVKDATENEDHVKVADQILYAVLQDGKIALVNKKPDAPQKVTGEKCETIISMDDFEGCLASVSVRAITRTDAGYPVDYRNGANGTPRTLQLAKRLADPETMISMQPGYDAEETTLREDIAANGLTLTVAENEKYAEVSGQYEIQLCVSDTDAEDADVKKIALTDSTRFMNGRLNEGASTYVVPNELTTEDGDTLYLADMAGKYLSVSLRATSDNAISSNWTEPTFLRIPRMQLTAPTVLAGNAAVQKYKVYGVTPDGQQSEMLNEDGTPNLITVKQETFSWDNDPTDGGYCIRLTRETDSVDDVRQRTAQEYVLTRDANGLRLGNQYLSSDGTTWYPLEGCKVRVQKDNVASWQYVYTEILAYIQVSEDKITICLPDNSENDAAFTGFATSGTWTKNLTVTALSPDQTTDGTPADYTDSMGSYQTRIMLEGKADWESGKIDQAKLPMVESVGDITAATAYLSDANRISTHLSVVGNANYRLMMQLDYRDAAGAARTLESAMLADKQLQTVNYFDLGSILNGDWTQITGVRYRLICVSDRELVGNWSETFPLNIINPTPGKAAVEPDTTVPSPGTEKEDLNGDTAASDISDSSDAEGDVLQDNDLDVPAARPDGSDESEMSSGSIIMPTEP